MQGCLVRISEKRATVQWDSEGVGLHKGNIVGFGCMSGCLTQGFVLRVGWHQGLNTECVLLTLSLGCKASQAFASDAKSMATVLLQDTEYGGGGTTSDQ